MNDQALALRAAPKVLGTAPLAPFYIPATASLHERQSPRVRIVMEPTMTVELELGENLVGRG
jgi:hypothetical protein